MQTTTKLNTPMTAPKQVKKQDINSVIHNLSNQITSTMLKKNKKKVAVTNFLTIRGERTDLGLFLSDKLTNSLFQFGDKFEVVERRRMEALQEEILLGFSGLIDEDTAQDLGKATGADAIVIGTITDMVDEVDISLRMLGTERANVMAVATATLEKSKAVARLMSSITLAKKVSQKSKKKNHKKISPEPKPIEDEVSADVTETSKEQPQKKVGVKELEMEGFLFQLYGCSLSGSSAIKCTLLITNKENDRNLIIYRDGGGVNITRMFDYSGNEYPVSVVTLGNTTNSSNIYFSKMLIKGIPTKLSVLFKGVTSEKKGLSVLDINLNKGSQTFQAQFRDVPLISQNDINGTILATQRIREAEIRSDNVEQIIEIEGFAIQLKSCNHSASSAVKCTLLITNKENDRNLIIYRDGGGVNITRIFDYSGNEYS